MAVPYAASPEEFKMFSESALDAKDQKEFEEFFKLTFANASLGVQAKIATSEMAFKGMDLRSTRAMFFKRGKKEKRTADQMMNDATYLIAVCLTRGSGLKKIKNRSVNVSNFNALCGVYEITDTIGRSQDPNVITLPRLSMAFAHITCAIAALPLFKPVIGHATLPKIYQWPGAACVVPGELQDAFVSWSRNWSDITRQQQQAWKDMTEDDKNENVLRYAELGFNSDFYNETFRIRIYDTFGDKMNTSLGRKK
jgi:hypothetical protein